MNFLPVYWTLVRVLHAESEYSTCVLCVELQVTLIYPVPAVNFVHVPSVGSGEVETDNNVVQFASENVLW